MDLTAVVNIEEPEELASASMADLRGIRNDLQTVENGLSFARRMIQGRLDTVAAESERRASDDGDDSTSIVERLPSTLAAGTRSTGLPRPPQELEPPPWVDQLVAQLDSIIGPSELGRLAELDPVRLGDVTDQLAVLEREVSAARRDVHARIDRIQDELVDRYRAGATVDDLLA